MLGARLAMSGPHDLFARYTFGHPERAATELRAVLPQHVVPEVDWSSPRREPGSVVVAPLSREDVRAILRQERGLRQEWRPLDATLQAAFRSRRAEPEPMQDKS